MRLAPFLALLLAGLSLANPIAPRDNPVGNWVMYSLQRACALDQSSCEVRFLLGESNVTAPTFCNFTIPSTGGKPAYQCNVTNTPCFCDKNIIVNSGYNPEGFSVLTVISMSKKQNAWFGASDQELANNTEMNPMISPVFQITPSWRRDAADGGGSVSLENAANWTLHGMARFVATATNEMWIMFNILNGDDASDSTVCSIRAPVPEGDDPAKASFYGIKCEGSDWAVSWGYDNQVDSAVITVMNPGGTRDAFFGLDNVNSGNFFADVGPNPTYET